MDSSRKVDGPEAGAKAPPAQARVAAAPGRRQHRIGELARQLGLTTRSLRYWEERGLLPPTTRSSGGMRLYGDEHIRATRGITRLKHAGFSLDEIVAIQGALGGSGNALTGMRSVVAALLDRENSIREHIREQQALLAELEAARRCAGLCDGCHGKPYDSDCISCLHDASGHALPDCLTSLLEAAVPRSADDPSSLPAR